MNQNGRPVQQMLQVIWGICVNAIRNMPMADSYVPTCRENPLWTHLLKTDEGEGQTVMKPPSKWISDALEVNTGTAVVCFSETKLRHENFVHVLRGGFSNKSCTIYLQLRRKQRLDLSPGGSQSLISCSCVRVRHEFVDVALSQQHLAYCLLPRLAAWLAAIISQC